MIKTDLLFQLIKSLSRGEKRNFKVLTQLTSGDKKYISLFDAIDRMEVYDEARLIREINDEAFTRQFSVAKNYLYNSILKSLTYFYKGQTGENFALSLQVRILMEKRLFVQAHKILNKALDRAEKQENFYELLQLFQLERLILRQTESYRKLNQELHEINLRERIALEKLNNLHGYHFLYDQVVNVITGTSVARHQNDESLFAPILANALMEDDKQAISIRAKIRYWTIMHRFHRFKNDRNGGLDFIRNIVATYEANPAIQEDEWIKYIEEVCNLVTDLHGTGRIPEAMKALKKLESVRVSSRAGFDFHFGAYYTLLLNMYINLGDIPRATQLSLELEKQLPAHLGRIPKQYELRLYLFCALAHFFESKFSKALKWINLFLNEPRTELHFEMQCLARVLNVMIHYELGNQELLDREIKSATRFLYKRDRLLNFEQALFTALRNWSLYAPQQVPREEMQQLLEQTEALAKDPLENYAISILDIPNWIRARIQGRPYLELREKKFVISHLG